MEVYFSAVFTNSASQDIETYRTKNGGGGGIYGDFEYGRRKNTKGKLRREGEGRNKEPQRHYET